MENEDLIKLLNKKTYIDAFAGCGGLSLGLLQSGWEGIFAIEKDAMAFETISKNMMCADAPYGHFEKWPNWLPKQNYTIENLLNDEGIRKKLKGLNGKISLICGGPPCQGFSVGGLRNGDDPRNELAFKMLELVELVEPPLVMIENVEGIARPFKARPGQLKESVATLVLARLRELGYSSGFTTIKSSDYGVPQERKRVVIVGIKKQLKDISNVKNLIENYFASVSLEQRRELNLPLDRPVNIEEALHDLANATEVVCPDSPKFPSTTYLPAKSTYAKLMRRGISNKSIPNSHRFSQHGPKVRSLYIAAHKTQPKGRLSKEFLLASGTKTDKKFLLDPKKPCSTLTTHPDEIIHYLYPRNVSIREMARIQSFPDDFHFYGRYTLNGERRKLDVSRCAQVGNAIPPLMARAMGMVLNKIIKFIEGDEKAYLSLSVLASENYKLFEVA
ncbi:MAG: DNA cytosine methyltransferase [Alphaproteobacteria bacterium]